MKHILLRAVLISIIFLGCKNDLSKNKFSFFSEQFSDTRILRYKIPGFQKLNLKQKKLVYYLTQAGLSGRDIIYDQNYKHNLSIRRALENIYQNFKGDRSLNSWGEFEIYLKKIWFSNGIHHHYSNDKFIPKFSKKYLKNLLDESKTSLNYDAFDAIFNSKDSKKVNLDTKIGLVKGSAINFYDDNIIESEVNDFYKRKNIEDPSRPISLGLNSKLIKVDGVIKEKVWKLDGMYSNSIEKIIFWLKKAKSVSENDQQKKAFGLLIKYYETGDLKIWDDYNIEWVKTLNGDIDYINGFIEVYNDPMAYKASFESVVQIKDFEMSKKMDAISKHAQWFEDNSTISNDHKRKNVVGISYNTVNVASEAGATSPSSPIGINLPNANWIRAKHGSKSVSLGNILFSYANAGSSGRINEFAYNKYQIEIEKKYGSEADDLHTALHEVIGHASGKIIDGVGTPKETLKSYSSTLEEARADLVGLYFIADSKMKDIGITDHVKEYTIAQYNGYIRNGLMTQLIRINLGNEIEESHMRNRQMISKWVYEKGMEDNIIEKIISENKTYFVINDYDELRDLFGVLLNEIQRIKSEGDYEAGKNLVENYGVKVDIDLHEEILLRNKKFTSAPYSGFMNPNLIPVKNKLNEIIDIIIEQPESFSDQMLFYSEEYSTLPNYN
ncbi:MAG: dihydrofolate reductase [Flavobacteriales bacterium]|nr:dihydrofolate reductase [Flavobacteriales bacterium]